MKNQELGTLIGVSAGAASRLRHGQRSPSLPTMVRIEAVLGWPLAQQIVSKAAGQIAYGADFARIIGVYEQKQARRAHPSSGS